MTGCGCLVLVALIVGGLGVFLFGSTDPGEPIETATAFALGAFVALRAGRTLAPSEA